jgi:hypothetical protein
MAKPRNFKRSRAAGLKHGWRSGLEEKVGEELRSAGVPFGFESSKIEYEEPARKRKYTPDFFLQNGIIVETKGRFVAADRKKHLLIQEQYPDLDIRFVFSNSNQKLYKGSKSTYADWCRKHGFKFADKSIPTSWIEEGSYG